MGWLRHVIVDLLISAIILVATVYYQPWAAWVVWIYTPFLLLMKVGALWSNIGGSGDSAPDWFYHLLYAVNLTLLMSQGWYWTGAGWAAIWILSAVIGARNNKKSDK